MALLEVTTESSRTHDFHLASRRAEEAALRRYQAVHWLQHFVGPIGISSEPSEKEFISCLRNGIVLCNLINKIQPGSVPKVVENHVPVHSESVIWDAQPLPAYQYFENVRNFLVAVKGLNLPAFEASDLERENFEAGSAARIADCVLALKSYHEWKEWSGGKGVYKHVTVKSPLVIHSAAKNFSRPLCTLSSQPCRHLDMSAVDEKQLLTDSLVKALKDHMVGSKENINDNFLTSFQNNNKDAVQLFSDILSRCLEEKLRNRTPKSQSCSQETSRAGSELHAQPASVLKEKLFVQNDSKCCEDQTIKTHSNHWRALRVQERKLSDIRDLWYQTKEDFEKLHSQLFNDLKDLGSLVEEMSTPALGYQKVVQENRKLHNMVQDLKGNVRVYCRIRPVLNSKATNIIDVVGEDGSLVVVDPSKPINEGRKAFQFNRVYSPTVAEDELFKDAQPLIRSVMDGYNVCILAYGQTGSGKTHTMFGSPGNSWKQEMGITFLALNDLFQMANTRKEVISYEVLLQMVEISNDEIRDLLVGDSNFQEVTIHSVKSQTDAINLVKRGEMNRVNASCRASNDLKSYCSHSIVTIHVQGKDASGNNLQGRLHLVDLAGSGKVDCSEDSLLDNSISYLEEIISSLSQKKAHIPQKDCKLTSILQDALGAHAKILMFAHVSPEADDFAETVSTLKFAHKVSNIELGSANSNKKNTEVLGLKQEIEMLKSALLDKDVRSPLPNSNRQLRSPSDKAKVVTVKSPQPNSNRQIRSPSDKAKIITEGTLRSRRLSMENCASIQSEKKVKSPSKAPHVATQTAVQKSLRMSVENASARKTEGDRDAVLYQLKEAKTPSEKSLLDGSIPRPRRLSIENPISVRSERAQRVTEPRSPYEDKKGLTKRTPPRTRRLSIENPNDLTKKTPLRARRLSIENPKDLTKKTPPKTCRLSIENPKDLTKKTPPRTRRLSIENPKSINSGVESKTDSKTPIDKTSSRVRRLSLEGPRERKIENVYSANVNTISNEFTSKMEVPISPPASAYLNQPTFTDCASKFSTLQRPKTPELQTHVMHSTQDSVHSGFDNFMDSQAPSVVRSTNGKGSQIKKSLRTIGKLINGAEKRNLQKMDSLSAKNKTVAANEVKSPPTSKARGLRRQSLTGIPPSGFERRSSLGGTSNQSRTNDNRNAKTPPPVRSSTKMTNRWM